MSAVSDDPPELAESATGQTSGPWALYSEGQRWWFLIILGLVALSGQIDRALASILLEPIKLDLRASDTMMGLATGVAFAVSFALFGLPAARVADRGDRRWVIAISIAVWSVMTAVSGFVRNVWQLAATRVGVGIGEAGAGPASFSLICDYFPPEKRATAMAVQLLSASIGAAIAFILGTWLAEEYGWRFAVIALGLPGALITLLVLFGLDEPRRRRLAATTAGAGESLIENLLALARKRTCVLFALTMILFTATQSGLASWFPAYSVRVLKVSLVEMGAAFGLVTAGTGLLGTLAGGLLADRLTKRDRSWLFRLPGLFSLGACPVFFVALAADEIALFLGAWALAGFAMAGAFPALFAGFQLVVGANRRAISVAIINTLGLLVGGALGPLLTGAISDALAPSLGSVSLRYALMSAVVLLVPCGLLTLACARTMRRDLEE